MASALLMLAVYAQAATSGIRLSARMFSALLASAFAAACLTLATAAFILRPLAIEHLLWLAAAAVAGLAGCVSAYCAGYDDISVPSVAAATAHAPAQATVSHAALRNHALWRLGTCTNLAVLLIALPDPFTMLTPEPMPWAASIANAAAGTAVIGCVLLLTASALHVSSRTATRSRHAFITIAVLAVIVAGLAAWLPDIAHSVVLLGLPSAASGMP